METEASSTLVDLSEIPKVLTQWGPTKLPDWFFEFRPVIHLVLHLAAPGIVAGVAYRERWLRAWAIMFATMLVDLDHFLADPIYDPDRCGVGFHPLHSYPAIAGYFALFFSPRARLIATGLLLHMALDAVDCGWLSLAPGSS